MTTVSPGSEESPIYLVVADHLRDMIVRGELQEGHKLPSESELARLWGISRGTVREALKVLVSMDLLETRRGAAGGHFVAVPEPDTIRGYLTATLSVLSATESISVGALLEARAIIEAPAAALAASRAEPEDLRRLSQALEHERIGRREDFLGPQLVHTEIIRATRNDLLMIMARPLFDVMRNRFLRSRAPKGFWEMVDEDHHRLLEALQAGDASGAEREMREHLERLRPVYERIDKLTLRLDNVTAG